MVIEWRSESTTAEEGAARAELLIEQLELEACADTCIGTDTRRGISGGQKRRVNIARAFANSPNIIFLDGKERFSHPFLGMAMICSGAFDK